ncbi:MAG: dCTP deaminase [Firmicutes bacterium]|nr:dCTP deaminase [Bacillota bacterium]
MILSGIEIKKQYEQGNIFITDFDEKNLGPNSYDLTLHDELLVYTDKVLDMKQPNATKRIKIPAEGLVLEPGILYLGRTTEWTTSKKHAPMLEGRSSIGRLGIFIHVTAGFGDVGYDGTWTLEIQVIHPIRVYPGVRIGQIYFHTVEGEFIPYGETGNNSGKYNKLNDIKASMLYKDFEEA